MTAFHGLVLAIEKAEYMRDESAKLVARLVNQLGSLEAQMNQLQTYAQDTEKRWINSALSQVSGEMVRHHYQFMGRLQHAIALQTSVISSAQNEIAVARKNLMELEVRLSGLRGVLKSRQAIQQSEENRREQKQMDELAAMAFARHQVSKTVGEHHDH